MEILLVVILIIAFAFFARTYPGIRQVLALLWIIGSPCVAIFSLFGIAIDPNGAPYAVLFIVYAIGTIAAIVWLIKWRFQQARHVS
jgi:hypothetical protein